jgi:anti-anti-sigma factor
MSSGVLTTETRRGHGWVVVVVQGDIDLENVARLRHALGAACADPPCNLLIDLRAVDFFGASALRALAETTRFLRSQGFCVSLCGLTPVQERVVELGGLKDLLDPTRGSEWM